MILSLSITGWTVAITRAGVVAACVRIPIILYRLIILLRSKCRVGLISSAGRTLGEGVDGSFIAATGCTPCSGLTCESSYVLDPMT